MVAATLAGSPRRPRSEAQRLRHGPQVAVEPALGRISAGGVSGLGRSAAGGVREKLGGEFSPPITSPGHLSAKWAEELGLHAGIPIPVGAFDAHWDAIGSNCREGDVVNVVGTSTCIIAMAKETELVPGVCGVVPGSVHPEYTGIEAGLSATGDIFEAIARRAGSTVADAFQGWKAIAPGRPACCA
jgi:L-ribulokinase